ALRAAAEVVALDGALEALALRGAGDLDGLADRERLDGDRLADLEPVGGARGDAELLDVAQRRSVRLLEVPELGPGEVLRLGGAERELDGLVAVPLQRADRGDRAGAGLEDGHALDVAVFGEHLGHSELAGEDRW